MKQNLLILVTAFFGSVLTVSADLTIPSDGSDGILNITEDTVIDLGEAVTGTWDQNNSANAGKGVYDPEKWAVVFKYSSVNIEGHTTGTPGQLAGRTLKFKNHPSHAPVVWLVQGNVTINGILDLSGQDGTADQVLALTPAEPGPGGFRGGARGPSGQGGGLGPGGAQYGGHYGGWASYVGSYGNPQIIPLVGGSGGGANNGSAGSGAGGAILIAASNAVTVNGLVDVREGTPTGFGNYGSSGAVRIIAASVSGGGSLNGVSGGRIRIETVAPLTPTLRTFPETIGVPPTNPPIIWPASNSPKARVISVDAVSPENPDDPRSPLIAAADVAIQNNAPVNIMIETRDFPIEGEVQLFITPKFAYRTTLTATRTSGDINLATWRVTTTLPQGFVTLQARATQP